MTTFTLSAAQAEKGGEYTPIPEGRYEAFIGGAEVKQAKSGNMMITLQLIIRDDVEVNLEEARKRKVFENLVFVDNMMWKVSQVGLAVGLPDGFAITSLEEFAKILYGKAVLIETANKTSVWQGKERINTNVKRFSPSLVGGTMPEPEEKVNDPFAASTEVTITDDDLPF